MILTQDGLIVTLNSLVPFGADYYQIAIGDKLDRGRVVIRDNKSNLAIVALDETGFLPVAFRNLPLDSEQLFIVSQSRNLDRPTLTVRQLSANQSGTEFPGSAVANSNGEVIGIVDADTKSDKIVATNNIEDLFFKYVSNQK